MVLRSQAPSVVYTDDHGYNQDVRLHQGSESGPEGPRVAMFVLANDVASFSRVGWDVAYQVGVAPRSDAASRCFR